MRLAPFAPAGTAPRADGPSSDPPDGAEGAGGDRADVALLLHGFGADRLSWLANAPALANAADVLAPDLPGHGASAAIDPDGFDGTLGAVRAAVDAWLETRRDSGRPVRLHLVGHSLGGALAIALAADPALPVASLVAIAPAGLGAGIDVGWLRALVALRDEARALEHLRRLVADPRMISRQAAGALVAHLGRDGVRARLDTLARDLDGLETRVGSAAREVASRGVPRASVWGELDAVNPPDPARAAALGVATVRVERAGHLPHVERAGRFNRLALELIGSAAPAAR